MNTWRSRLAVGLVFCLAMALHADLTANVQNTDSGMLLFHGSSAIFDLLLIYIVPIFLSGQLASDMEALCVASIVANFVGWIAYTAYAPPIYYNVFMWVLAYVQWARLFIMGGDDANYHGLYMVRRNS